MLKALVLSALVLSASFAHADDPIVQLFNDGRADAIQQIAKLKPCSFPSSVASDVIYWIMLHQAELQQDLQNSPHNWITDSVPTCASTTTQAQASITLSYTACRTAASSVEAAAQILTRESVHHMGISDDAFTDSVTSAIFSAVPCPGDVDDPFNPLSCQGSMISVAQAAQYFSPGAPTSEVFAHPEMHRRFRNCNKVSGCTPWTTESAPLLFTYEAYVPKTASFATLGDATFETIGTSGDIKLSIVFSEAANQGAGSLLNCPSLSDSASCNLTTSVFNSSSYPVGFEPPFGSSYVIFNSFQITPTCLRMDETASTSPDSSTGEWSETELVISAKY